MSGRRTILIVGGYGTFGGRLARLLAGDPALLLLIAGRSLARAKAFAATLPAGAGRRAVQVDRAGDVDPVLDAERPDVLVDCTGPFQAYGADPYGLVRAALRCNVSYLDLADSAAFVAGIAAFDAEARAKGLFVLSGVSSFPVLTAAAVRALDSDLVAIDGVTGGIAPSPYAGVGLNVIRAIAGYAGQPTRVVRNGALAEAHPLTETLRYTIAPPGRLPLRNTRFSLVDVPDLLLVPAQRPDIRNFWMGAGPVPEILHRALNVLAWGVRLRLLPTLSPLAPLCFWAINRFRWGEHRGGMFVELTGRDARGRQFRRSWHMLAEGDDGPLIPSMAVAVIVSKLAEGEMPVPGARPATDVLELADYDRAFAGRAIYCGLREDSPAAEPLYRKLLGRAWDALPPTLHTLHSPGQRLVAAGRAEIRTGSGLLARLARRLFGFPSAGRDVPVVVTFEATEGVETWHRRFGDMAFSSTQRAGTGRDDRLLVESFGPVAVSLAVVADTRRLSLVVRRWKLFGVPMPLFLAPTGETAEFEEDGRFHFDVALGHPLTGPIVHYVGWLVP